MPDLAAHPTDDTLASFGLGKTDDATTDLVARHITVCAACRKRVAELPADSFLGKLRLADLASTSGPDATDPGAKKSVAPQIRTDTPTELDSLADQYEIKKELGRGGMGVVYLAHNKLLARDEVLKVVNADLLARPGAVERFLREIQSAARLSHANVVTAFSALRPAGGLVFAMEYVPGVDLNELVKQHGPLPIPRACQYTAMAALGLQHAHERGMVHRDIKPGNLLLTRVGKKPVVKVLDFGLAKVIDGHDAGLTRSGQMLGTPAYIAPEQAEDAAKADIRADIYSLGCTLYFLLAGTPPFDGSVMNVLVSHKLTPLPELPNVPPQLNAVIQKMTAKTPADRYPTPMEVARALQPFVKQVSQSSTEASTGPVSTIDYREPEPVRRRPKWVMPAAVGGLLAVVLAALAVGGAFKVKMPTGTLVVENVPDDAVVEVDGQTVKLTRNGQEVRIEGVPAGPHKLKVTVAGVEVLTDDVTVKLGGDPVRARVETPPPDGTSDPVDEVPPVQATGRVETRPTSGWKPLLTDGRIVGTLRNRSNDRQGWKVIDSMLVGTGTSDRVCYLLPTRYADVRVRAEVFVEPGSKGWLILRADDREKGSGGVRPWGYGVGLGGNGPAANPGAVCEWGYMSAPLPILHAGATPSALPAGKWCELDVTAKGNTVRVVIDGVIAAEATDPANKYPDGYIGFAAFPNATIKVRRIEVSDPNTPPPPADAGFTPLFNGTDLTGWRPSRFHKDKPVAAVRDGAFVLAGTGGGNGFYTDKSFADFHLRAEVLKVPNGTGVLIVRSPEREADGVRIDGYIVTCGYGAVNNRPFGSFARLANHKAGEEPTGHRQAGALPVKDFDWFRLDVVCVGGTVTVSINGTQVHKFIDPDPLPPGPVRLVGGFGKEFPVRKLEIKELPPADAGFVPLFNGRDLTNWQKTRYYGQPASAAVRDGVLTLTGTSGGNGFYSDKAFGDFHLRAEVLKSPNGTGMICVRSPEYEKDGVRFDGYFVGCSNGGNNNRTVGDVSRMAAHRLGDGWTTVGSRPDKAVAVTDYDWFRLEIVAVGGTVVVSFDGKEVNRYTDPNPLPPGPVRLTAGWGKELRIRKLEVKELPPK